MKFTFLMLAGSLAGDGASLASEVLLAVPSKESLDLHQRLTPAMAPERTVPSATRKEGRP